MLFIDHDALEARLAFIAKIFVDGHFSSSRWLWKIVNKKCPKVLKVFKVQPNIRMLWVEEFVRLDSVRVIRIGTPHPGVLQKETGCS